MHVESLDTIVGLSIVVVSVTADLPSSQLQISSLIDVGGVLPSEKEVTIYESLSNECFEDVLGGSLRSGVHHLLDHTEFCEQWEMVRLYEQVGNEIGEA